MRENETATLSTKLKLFTCGFISGLLQAGAFNPWDRALYLSVKMDRQFLDLRNFEHPMAGAMQTIVQRAISAGLYFPFEELFRDFFSERLGSSSLSTFFAGISAGAVNGFIMNPVSATKYNYWGQPEAKGTFITTAVTMFRVGGIRPFYVGATATILRDLGFGGIFAILRHELLGKKMIGNSSSSNSSSMNGKKKKDDLHMDKQVEEKKNVRARGFVVNLFSACIATIASSPLNYVRNVHYATPPSIKAEGTIKILNELWFAASNEPNLRLRLKYLQSRLRLGWGTARVGCGMAFGAFVYSLCSSS
jgi:hypothetical protein